jgi:hypothetical protein
MSNIFNLPKALSDGYSYTDVAEALAKQKNFNLAKAREDGYDDRTIAATLSLGRPITASESFFKNLEQGLISDYAGLAQLAKPVSEGLKKIGIDTSATEQTGIEPEGYSDPTSWMAGTPVSPEAEARTQKNALRNELEARILADEKTGAAIAGRISGALTSPINLLPVGRVATTAEKVRGFGIAGALGGALDPVYEELGDTAITTRAENIALGATLGGALGGVIGGGKAVIGRIFSKKGNELADVTDEVSQGTADLTKPHFKYKGVDEEGKPLFEQVGTKATTPTPTRTADDDLIEETQNVFDVTQLPKLPQYLSGSSPSFGKSSLSFETDLDKALYIVGRSDSKSTRHEDFVQYLQQSLGVPRDEVLRIAKEARDEMVGSMKVSQRELGIRNLPQDSLKVSLSKTLDNILNPVDKNLDNFSKSVYNYGKTLPVNEAGKFVISPSILKSEGFQKLSTAVRQYMPKASDSDSLVMIKGYQDMMDKLKEIDGRNFKARSFEDMLKNKDMNEDLRIKLYNSGEFDGC